MTFVLLSNARPFVFLMNYNNTKKWFYFKVSVNIDSALKSTTAVAKRPRDVSCLSVVSFNSIIRRAPSSING